MWFFRIVFSFISVTYCLILYWLTLYCLWKSSFTVLEWFSSRPVFELWHFHMQQFVNKLSFPLSWIKVINMIIFVRTTSIQAHSYRRRWDSSSCLAQGLPCTVPIGVLRKCSLNWHTILHCWKAYEICYKIHTTLPPHLTHVATLLWEIKRSNFLQLFSRYGKMQTNCIFIPSSFIVYLQILIF